MTNSNTLFRSFAKGSHKPEQLSTDKSCIIYTRVSTKEQADNNLSLETQKKGCELYAQKNGYQVRSCFGGTYESAQTDERKQFIKMVEFAKKNKVPFIIVYSLERFSRTGDNAIWLSRQLRDAGINIISVTQPIDTSNPAGVLQQNILFLFSQFDNDLRKQKCMAGIREKLLRGEWAALAPIGYDNISTRSHKTVAVNEKGRLIRKAFLWKANDNLSSEDIRRRLATEGLKIDKQTLSSVLRNPFYCGMITHKMLEGQIVEGKHERLISKEMFLKANDLLNSNAHGYRQNNKNNKIPLKRFLKCEGCGKFLRGYIVKQKGIYYYKCADGKCGCNKNAEALHERFKDILSYFEIPEIFQEKLRIKLREVFEQMNSEVEEDSSALKQRLSEVDKKLKRLKDRFIEEEIDRDMFEGYGSRYKAEKAEIERELEKRPQKKSNLEKFVERSLELSCKLEEMWSLGTYEEKQKLQYLIFPEGIYYDKKTDGCRTLRINFVFELISSMSEDSGNKKRGQLNELIQLSPLVAAPGIEPRSKV